MDRRRDQAQPCSCRKLIHAGWSRCTGGADVVRDSSRRDAHVTGKRCGMVMDRAAATGLPRCDERVRAAATAAMSSQEKDAEILALRHQLSVLQRQLGPDRVRFTPADRTLLAALLHGLPRDVLKRLRLVVSPDTVLRWHRDMLARWHAQRSRPARPGRPRTVRSIRVLVLRLVCDNTGWGYRRVHGELLVLGVKVAASTVWEILHEAGIDPAPERSSATWAGFLRSQAGVLLACDFFKTVTLSGARLHVLAVIEHASRRIRILGATAHPTAPWVAQAARNLVMDQEDAGCRARYLIRDRDGKFPALFDTILADAASKLY
jgi:putative transposase